MLTVVTLGDSILDCGRYNEYGVTPGQLVVANDDRLFPEFQKQDLSSRGPARLEHRARDGSTLIGLQPQLSGLRVDGPTVGLLTIGGNDLLMGLAADHGPGINAWAEELDQVLRAAPVHPLLIATVYDPTFGDDSRNFLGIDPSIARASLNRMNARLVELGNHYGASVDLHAHFLSGDASWFTRTIEPSLRGASEVRRAFLGPLLAVSQRLLS
jgi:acyl-CoA thioesterase I